MPGCRGGDLIRDQEAIAQGDAAVGEGGDGWIVGDENEGGSFGPIETKKEIEHVLAVDRIEIAGGLVGRERWAAEE